MDLPIEWKQNTAANILSKILKARRCVLIAQINFKCQLWRLLGNLVSVGKWWIKNTDERLSPEQRCETKIDTTCSADYFSHLRVLLTADLVERSAWFTDVVHWLHWCRQVAGVCVGARNINLWTWLKKNSQLLVKSISCTKCCWWKKRSSGMSVHVHVKIKESSREYIYINTCTGRGWYCLQP